MTDEFESGNVKSNPAGFRLYLKTDQQQPIGRILEIAVYARNRTKALFSCEQLRKQPGSVSHSVWDLRFRIVDLILRDEI